MSYHRRPSSNQHKRQISPEAHTNSWLLENVDIPTEKGQPRIKDLRALEGKDCYEKIIIYRGLEFYSSIM
jgi:hypothetical protein